MVLIGRNYGTIRACKISWPPPEFYNFATDVVDKWAAEKNNKVAMVWTNGQKTVELTFRDISEKSKRLAEGLVKLGCKRDDIVLLIMGREIEWWIALTACLRMGAVCSPGTTQLSSDDIAYRIKAAEATCVITDHENARKIEKISQICPTLKTKIKIGEVENDWKNLNAIIEESNPPFTALKLGRAIEHYAILHQEQLVILR